MFLRVKSYDMSSGVNYVKDEKKLLKKLRTGEYKKD